ncbi:MAG TPA: 5-oxoprolinase subunit PxpB [Trueperaceae bacterium]|nr:5-oxoprolinase subunit PxpB [Trueperaceae bacterium]
MIRKLGWLYLRSGEMKGDLSAEDVVGALVEAAGVTDVVPSYDSVFVEFDARVTTEEVLRHLVAGAATSPGRYERQQVQRTVSIPTLYGGVHGPDLEEVARVTGMSEAQVVAAHAGAEYRVAAMGFLPGFAFMTGVHPALRVPRRATPRATVPAHSVAIANAQAGVYPLESPGGWNLLGRALIAMYDPHRAEPFLVRPGDVVRFEPATPDGEPPPSPLPVRLLPVDPRLPTLKVIVPGLLDLVVDEGRFLVGRFGLARSGPLDAGCATLANRLIGNPPHVPVLESTLTGPVLEAVRDVVVAVTGDALVPMVDGVRQASWTSLVLRRGQVLSFAPGAAGSRAYLAVPGGIESATFMGSVAVDLRGLLGRSLRADDVIGTLGSGGARAGRSFRPHARQGHVVTVRIVPGPQASEAALAALTDAPFTVSRGDRTGIQLEGAAVPGGEVVSEGTPIGAVQVTSGGSPIVLMHDRGTLGGYHKPAVVHPDDLAKVAQMRPHQLLRFVLTTGGRTAESRTSPRDRPPTR